MPNEVDTIMDIIDKDAGDMVPQDIDAIIAYHRKNRANSAAGIKPAKGSAPKVAISLESLGLKVTAAPTAENTLKRRV